MTGNPYLPMGPRFRPRLVYRCVQATLTSGDEEYTVKTRYEYDEELKISKQTATLTENLIIDGPPISVVLWQKDAYGIKTPKYGPGQQPSCLMAYEWLEDKLSRVVVSNYDGSRTIYVVGYHNAFPHKRGLPVRISQVSQEGKLLEEHQYEYDCLGRETGMYQRTKPTDEFTLVRKRELSYDKHGHVTKIVESEPDYGTQTYSILRNYSRKGYCTDARFIDTRGNVLYWFEYTYQQFKLPKKKEIRSR